MGEAVEQGLLEPGHGLSLRGLGEGHVQVEGGKGDRVGLTVLGLVT